MEYERVCYRIYCFFFSFLIRNVVCDVMRWRSKGKRWRIKFIFLFSAKTRGDQFPIRIFPKYHTSIARSAVASTRKPTVKPTTVSLLPCKCVLFIANKRSGQTKKKQYLYSSRKSEWRASAFSVVLSGDDDDDDDIAKEQIPERRLERRFCCDKTKNRSCSVNVIFISSFEANRIQVSITYVFVCQPNGISGMKFQAHQKKK